MPARGTSCLYRPVPNDFDETFIRLGWTSIEAHYAAHAKTVRKWLDLRNPLRVKAGGVPLQVARAAYVRKHGPAKSPARIDYALRVVRKRKLATVTEQMAEA